MRKTFATFHHQQLTPIIVPSLPNELTDEVLDLLKTRDLLVLRGVNTTYRSYVHKLLHQSRLWTAKCYNNSNVILRSDEWLATPLQNARHIHYYIHIDNIRKMHLQVFVEPMCRTPPQSINKFAKWLRAGRLAALLDLRVTIHLKHTKVYSNAQIEKDIIMATRGLKDNAEFHGIFRLDVSFARPRVPEREADNFNQDEIRQWLSAYREEIRQTISCKVVRRTSKRLEITSIRKRRCAES